MKKLAKVLIIILLGIFIAGCVGKGTPQPVTKAIDSYEVTFLFEMENGMKMYRFYDGGYYHYFTTRGETITSVSSGKTQRNSRIESN